MPVPVSVIIPTYNWSEALRVSIASALDQTFRDFELLVIGDCCTDDSAEVALSFGDSRVQWHNLPVRHSTQSGPNNHGISIAAGALIAYLGHDDVWHPGHLSSLVATIEASGAGLACGVTAMYGPPGSGFRALSGIFVEGRCRREDFVPPSSLMHRRLLTDRIGPWPKPEDGVMPVDCDLLSRAYGAGEQLVSTDRLTVFKFNSAWRRDSYLKRDASEQRKMLDRLRADPAKCVEDELVGLLRAMREKRLIETIMPDNVSGSAGGYHHENLRNRGLEDGEIGELTEMRRFSLVDQASALDWYPAEDHGDWGACRWSGPAPVAVIVLPVSVPTPFRLRLQLLNWLQVDFASELAVSIGGRPVDFTRSGGGDPIVLVEVVDSGEGQQLGPLRIQLKVARLRCPYFDTGGTNPDSRWLGVCVNWIEVEPLPPEGAVADYAPPPSKSNI